MFISKKALLAATLFATALTTTYAQVDPDDDETPEYKIVKVGGAHPIIGVSAERLFGDWTGKHNKSYTSAAEKKKRMDIWLQTDSKIKAHNKKYDAGQVKWYMGHNEYSDMTPEEFANHFNLFASIDQDPIEQLGMPVSNNFVEQVKRLQKGRGLRSSNNLKDAVDWKSLGVVTDVKNQGGCGSCWAFAATAGMESVKAINDGELIGLSEQELVDCSSEEDGNYGCQGGWPKNAVTKYVKKKRGGICSDVDYPYTGGETGSCLADSCTVVPGTLFSGCRYAYSPHDPTQRSAQGVMDAVAVSPVIVAVSAAPYADWLSYAGGIFDNAECGLETETPVDHAVLLTGYGEDADGNMFWEFKNSWGAGWGDAGYIKFDRDPALTDHDGRCGMLRYIMQPFF